MTTKDSPITLQFEYQQHLHVLWKALTDLTSMKQWYFDNIDAFEPEIGHQSNFVVHSDERQFTHQWEVIEAIPHKRIGYTWSYAEYDGKAKVYFDLIETDTKTVLILTMHIEEDFPSEIPEFEISSCQKGWQFFLGERLTEFLAK